MLFLIKINCIFTSLKIPSFCQKKEKNIFVHTAKSLKKKKITSYFHTTKKTSKKKLNVLAYILALITSLLKSRELGQYFKNSKEIILFS